MGSSYSSYNRGSGGQTVKITEVDDEAKLEIVTDVPYNNDEAKLEIVIFLERYDEAKKCRAAMN